MAKVNGGNGFKETEVGDIPQEWDVLPLGQFADLNLGRTPPRKQVAQYWTNGVVPWVSIGDLNNGTLVSTAECVSQTAFEQIFHGKTVPAGTLLMSFKLTIGKVSVLGVDAVHNEAIVSIFPNEQVAHRDYLFFLLQFLDYDAFLDAYVKGRTLNKDKLLKLPIPLPSPSEQRGIARVLSTIQRAMAAQEAVIAAAREVKRSLMRRLFTYGPYADPLPTKETEIGEVPEHWQVVELGELVDIAYGVQAAVANLTDDSIGIPILTNVNITLDGKLDLSTLRYYDLPKNKRDRLILRKGDVLFNWRSGSPHHVGKTAIFDEDGEYTFASFILCFRTKSTMLNSYLAHFLHKLKSQEFFAQRRSQSSVNSVFNKSAAAKIPVCVPPLSDQQAIVYLLQVADDKMAVELRRLAALQALFKSMLHELMTGKVRVGMQRMGSG